MRLPARSALAQAPVAQPSLRIPCGGARVGRQGRAACELTAQLALPHTSSPVGGKLALRPPRCWGGARALGSAPIEQQRPPVAGAAGWPPFPPRDALFLPPLTASARPLELPLEGYARGLYHNACYLSLLPYHPRVCEKWKFKKSCHVAPPLPAPERLTLLRLCPPRSGYATPRPHMTKWCRGCKIPWAIPAMGGKEGKQNKSYTVLR